MSGKLPKRKPPPTSKKTASASSSSTSGAIVKTEEVQVVHVLCDCVTSTKAQSDHNKMLALERRVAILRQEKNGLQEERDRFRGERDHLQEEMRRRNAEIAFFRNDRDVRGEESRCCLLCIRAYDGQVIPKVLTCGHTFCNQCIERISVHMNWGSYLHCSTCRTRSTRPAQGYPTVFAMMPAYVPVPPEHLQL
ncbi:hypothetical protein CRE_16330 [Caenorhabditis remanei]|uniref:RING-type domain-containing protein n=1 Tax=Caenorhabditis remanei TaxID=31234 RepID=E3N815_CAERE|nr:hypothetical protein CRE_16330 [Caenorhabditis remanei]